MAHPFLFSIRTRGSPTLWPLSSEEYTPLELAIEACEEENRRLKIMVISLSDLILGTMPRLNEPDMRDHRQLLMIDPSSDHVQNANASPQTPAPVKSQMGVSS